MHAPSSPHRYNRRRERTICPAIRALRPICSVLELVAVANPNRVVGLLLRRLDHLDQVAGQVDLHFQATLNTEATVRVRRLLPYLEPRLGPF